ncbi:PQQ-dependent sugar dehydrogenase [Paraglaciecola aquimarina]|uniref:PQQ-dependent sugar dehydrogenase n=1 Tax=Paraglaciecola aquimarina TaxID=1235557 RepID=A0ABU3SVZ4_9ALTE|nr:PQQ-dependent sugar dehydrogenase [Paraglaciecola aquimarina]MDU0354190.1 PQQ-dependent sugar dehydrogenase [Paraglaciecola aquimarina]
MNKIIYPIVLQMSLFICLVSCPLLAQGKSDVRLAAEQRLKYLTLPDGLKADVWADETLTQNPAFFSFDEQGRMFIAEIERVNRGVADIRSMSQDMSVRDISIVTMEDRLKMYKSPLFQRKWPDKFYTDFSDKIRLVSDGNSDGIADTTSLFADDFNQPLDGLGSGVITRDGKVYYTNIPHLWQLEDKNNDGVSDERTSLQYGFGTRVSFIGHDLHGLAWGPDGRLYWSIGDRGYHLETREGTVLSGPSRGAIFRSNADGSNIEVFYHGLRNPQELVFDEYGNLFTADNDGDKGDNERIVHAIEGGDSGWHAGHQSIMSASKKLDLRSLKYTGIPDVPVSWLVNKMSIPRNQDQPAFMLPGIGKLFTGPSGITYNPTDNLGESWRNVFFIAHYSGTPSNGYISTFKTSQNGASFLAIEQKTVFKGSNVTDLEFGPDGRLYLSEYNYGGWKPANEGSIFTLAPIEESKQQKAKRTRYKQLLTSNFADRSVQELTELLAVDHLSVRQRAQFALAKRGKLGQNSFYQLALDPQQDTYSRIHSIWGLSQQIFELKHSNNTLRKLLPLLEDENQQVRIQTARVFADHAVKFAEPSLIKVLDENNDQASMYAAFALGKINSTAAVPSIIRKLMQIQDNDLWLRHSLVMALAGIDKESWLQHKKHSSKHVRMGLLLALRQLKATELAIFLRDSELGIVDEAVMAIVDTGLTSLRPQVAKVLSASRQQNSDAERYMHHRIINANFNLGDRDSAQRLLEYAATPGLHDRLAAEALAAIEGWHEINPIDTVTGLPTTADYNRANIQDLVTQYLPKLIATTKGHGLVQSMRLASEVSYHIDSVLLGNIVVDAEANTPIRMQAMDTLVKRKDETTLSIVKQVLNDSDFLVINKALSIVSQLDHGASINLVENFLTTGTVNQQKAALNILTDNPPDHVNEIILRLLNKLKQGDVVADVMLELIQAAERNLDPRVKTRISQYQEQLSTQDVLAQFASTAAGGDPREGEAIFFNDGAAQCVRCHRVENRGSSWVGPNLGAIGATHNGQYILQALVDPSAVIAPGFGTVTLELHSGELQIGKVMVEDRDTITLEQGRDNVIKVYQRKNIKSLKNAMSGMPPMNHILGKEKIRHLVAYLKTLQGKNTQAEKGH